MDGNARRTKIKNLPKIFGLKKGIENIKNIVLAAKDFNIENLTLFAFSTENK